MNAEVNLVKFLPLGLSRNVSEIVINFLILCLHLCVIPFVNSTARLTESILLGV